MRKTLLLTVLFCLSLTSIFAQEKKMLTPADAAYQNRSIYPVGKNVKWMPDTDKYVFTDTENPNNLMVQNATAKSATVLMTLDQVNSYLNAAGLCKYLKHLLFLSSLI